MGLEIPSVSLLPKSVSDTLPSAPNVSSPPPQLQDQFVRPNVTSAPGFTLDPGRVWVNASAQVRGKAGSASVRVDANIDQQVRHRDGYTTVTIRANASMTVSGKLDINALSVGGNVSAGGNVTYEVRLSDADFEKLKRGEIPVPNPLDPNTIPDGGSVRLDESQFNGTSLDAGFRYNALQLGVSGSTRDSQGTSLLVARTGSNVQVTAGPTEVLENDAQVKIGVGPVSIRLGNRTTVGDFDLRTASFDVGAAQGRSAFDAFASTGKIPVAERPGVTHALHIHQVDFNSTSNAQASLGPLKLDGGGGANTGSRITVVRPDGTSSDTVNLRYARADSSTSGPNLEIQRELDAQGHQIPGKTQYGFTFDVQNPVLRNNLLGAFTGTEHSPDANGNQPIRITMTEDQLRELQARARAWAAQGPSQNTFQASLGAARTPQDAALVIASQLQGQAFETQAFLDTYLANPERGPLPGTIAVR